MALTAALVVSAAMMSVLWSPQVARADTNGIANPSFETAGTSASDAANWTEGTSHTRSSDRFHSGGWSLKSTYTGAGTSTRASAITVSPNTSYVLSGWIYQSATTGSAYLDLSDIPGELNLNATQTNTWEFVSGTWSSGTATSVTIRLVTDHAPNGPIWFDDIALAPANAVDNPSFETAGATAADAASWTEGTSHTRSSDRVHSGSWALKSSYTGAGTSTRSAPISVIPNSTYTLSGYIWATNTTGGAYIDMSDIAGCGTNWLDTFAETGRYFNTSNQAPFLMISTWDDYEEGSEVETGIDNCVTSFIRTLTGSTLQWSVGLSGNGASERTIDHYTVWYSTDGATGEQLAQLTTLAPTGTGTSASYSVDRPSSAPVCRRPRCCTCRLSASRRSPTT